MRGEPTAGPFGLDCPVVVVVGVEAVTAVHASLDALKTLATGVGACAFLERDTDRVVEGAERFSVRSR